MNPRELSTVIAALRAWQIRNLPNVPAVQRAEIELLARLNGPALDTEEVAALCERLNRGEVGAVPLEVWLLQIDHRHGTDTTAHTTREGAQAALFSYVADWWEKEVGGEPMPEDRDAAIERYFEKASDESADISPAELEQAEPVKAEGAK